MKSGFSNIQSIFRTSFRHPGIWIVFSVFLYSCTSLTPVDYSLFDNFGSEGIPDGWNGLFTPVPTDSADIELQKYDVVLTVRYNGRCSSRNLILDIEEISLTSQNQDSTRLDLPLFHDNGIPVGKGNLGLFELTDTLRRDMNVPPGYTLAISTPFSCRETKGINAIGIKLVRSNHNFPLEVKNILK